MVENEERAWPMIDKKCQETVPKFRILQNIPR